MRVVAEAVFSDGDGPPDTERMDWLIRDLDDFLEHIGESRRSVIGALFGLHAVTPVVNRSPRSLASMSIPDRISALTAVEESFASGLLLAVKALLCIIYYEHPDAGREIGFDGGCLNEATSA